MTHSRNLLEGPGGACPVGLAPNACTGPAHDILPLQVFAEMACSLQGLTSSVATCRHLLKMQTMCDKAGRWLQQS